ncbi:magnesium transporter [Nannocystis pusilla]|uniref:Magnesium transporter MgtE n=1 Tax=Nannocystis pusilla TaxID=889268 RepID=A0ABS7U529_9BACT|nr:magnesium transporter [Nannocystis pusilla]
MDVDVVQDALDANDLAKAQEWLNRHAPHEVAAELQRLDPVPTAVAFRLLDKDQALEVFEELDPHSQQTILEGLRDEAFYDLVESLEPDDRARVVQEAPAKIAHRVLAGLSPAERQMTAALLGYPEGSVGRYMTPEMVVLRRGLTAAAALDVVRAEGRDAETIYVLPLVDDHRRLVGVTTLRELVLSAADTVVDMISEEAPRAQATDDAESAARLMQEANLLALIVVDSEERVVGLLTIDDAVELIEAADTEDVARQAGASPLRGHYLTASVLQVARSRATWLLLLLVAATLTVNVLQYFEDTLARVTALALFVPLLIGTGGNAGAQSATAVVRALAVGEVRGRDVFRVVWRESRVGLGLGLVLAVLALAIGALLVEWRVAATLAGSLVAICVWASVVGAVMPLLARRLGIDPAVISAPLVTTLVDATGLIIYFTMAHLILPL